MDLGEPVPTGRDVEAEDRLRRRVLWSMPSGLYVLGSVAEIGGTTQRNLMTMNWAIQVCTEPKLVAVAVESGSRTRSLVDVGEVFSLNVLRRADRALVRTFVKPVEDVVEDSDGAVVAMAGQPVRAGTTGSPVLEAARAWMECRVRQRLVLGSHVLYLGLVVAVGGEGSEGHDEGDDAVLRMEDTRMHYGG